MAINMSALPRIFLYSGITLPDPSPDMSPLQVRDLYSATYGELTSAAVDGPKIADGVARYEFIRAVRDKG